MAKHFEGRTGRNSGGRSRGLVRSVAQGVSAGGLVFAAFAWAVNRPHDVAMLAVVLELPGAVVSAPRESSDVPVQQSSLSYLSRAVADAEPDLSTPITRRIAAVLRRYAKDDRVADRAAAAVVSEGRKHNVDPMLLVGLMLTENARIDPIARSNVGAAGLMQIMPFHSGKWGCASRNLLNIESNICHGVNILAKYIHTSPNLNKALLRYNGCVRGRNTPNCHTYPRKVLGYANHASTMVTAMAQGRNMASISIYPRLNLGGSKATRVRTKATKSRSASARSRTQRVAMARRVTRKPLPAIRRTD
jgi:soluble lytic murein transglycosylase-like protein